MPFLVTHVTIFFLPRIPAYEIPTSLSTTPHQLHLMRHNAIAWPIDEVTAGCSTTSTDLLLVVGDRLAHVYQVPKAERRVQGFQELLGVLKALKIKRELPLRQTRDRSGRLPMLHDEMMLPSCMPSASINTD